MQIKNNFIFTCLIALILFTPILFQNIMAKEESVKHSANIIEHGEKVKENAAISKPEEQKKEEAAISLEGIEHGEEHGSSRIWPYYGKMVIFSKIMFAFMFISFIAPLAHFYIKGEKHH